MGALAAGLFLFVSLFAILPARAETPPPAEIPNNFIDNTHDVLSNSFYWPLVWFDHFFMSEREEYEINQSFFRVINNYTWINGKGFSFKPKLRMKIRLKAFQRRLSIIAFGENEDETVQTFSAARQAQIDAGITPVEDRTRVGVRYAVWEWLDSRFDADIVVSSKLVPEPALRARQNLYKSDRTLSRFTVTGFWEKDLRFGQTTQIDFAHQFKKRWAYDITLRGKQSQVIPAIVWDHSINTNYQLSKKEALALHLQASGPTRPHAVVQNYHTSVVYRRNFYRPWMFGEVEPGVDWPYLLNHRQPVWSTVFRLELQFKTQVDNL